MRWKKRNFDICSSPKRHTIAKAKFVGGWANKPRKFVTKGSKIEVRKKAQQGRVVEKTGSGAVTTEGEKPARAHNGSLRNS